MSFLIFLLGTVLLALPFVAIGALVSALRTRDRMRQVEWRLAAIERRLAITPIVATQEASARPVEPPEPEPEPQPEDIPARFREPAEPPAPEPKPASAQEPEPAPEPLRVPDVQPAEPPERHIGFEERFGTRWVVWIGGVALALGGIFLVRYSIEQGYLGPGVRVFLGGLLAVGLVIAGEWARRTERLTGMAGLPSAHIPSILTAAGTTVAYATVYAAYGLYGFLAPGSAFILLGLVALATLAAALLHGPALAGLGLVGAYVTPLLVASEKPDYWSLYIYLAVVTAAAFGMARLRVWLWLAMTAVAFGLAWTLPGIEGARVDGLAPHAFHVSAGLVLAAALLVSGLFYGPSAEPGRIDGVSSGAVSAYLLGCALLVLASRHDPVALWTFVALVVAIVAIAWKAESATAAVPVAAALATLVMIQWAVNLTIGQLIAPSGPTAGAIPEPERVSYGLHLFVGGGLAVLFGAAGFLAQGRSQHATVPILWSASGIVAPLAILVALYYRIVGFERSIPFAALALLVAALYGIATETLAKRPPRPGLASSTALYATGTLAALALAFTFALEKGWLTIALALMVPAAAWVSTQRPLPFLRWLAAAFVMLVLARIGWEPRIVGSDVGTTPIFNWLLYGYGIPAAAFWYAGWLLRRRADDTPARIVDSGAILFTVLLAFLQIRHYVNNGDVYSASAGLTEVALQVCVGLALTIGLERLRVRTGSVVHNIGALAVAALTVLGIVFGLGLGLNVNPLATGGPVGGVFFNLILLGYGLPAVLTATLALLTRGLRPRQYSAAAAVLAVALALGYLTLQVTRIYHGPILTEGETTDAEQYTYSAVWLAFGVVLLVVGIALRSQPVRLASAAVVILTVGKVFLFDMAGLTGAYRALSFIGLGLVLVGIGWLYQRLLFPPSARAPAAGAVPAD